MSVSAATEPKSPDETRPPAGKTRRALRLLRKLFLLLLFAGVAVAVYLNHFGLPSFMQQRLREALLAKGWRVDFTRLRLHSWRELAVEGFYLRRTNAFSGPELYLNEAYCRFRPRSLARLKLEVDAVRLHDGLLLLPVAGSNQTKRVKLQQMTGELVVKSDDQWELRNFQAHFLGAHVQFMGVLTNSSLLRDWKFARTPSARKRSGKAFWANVLRALEPIQFSGAPQLIAQFYGDAAEPDGIEASIRFAAPGVATPWGAGADVRILARLSPPVRDDDIVLMDLTISAQEAKSPWGEADHLEIHAQMEPSYPQLSTTNALFTIVARKAATRWAKMDRANFKARLTPCVTNSELLQTEVSVQAFGVEAQALRGETVDLSGYAIHPPLKKLSLGNTNLHWLERLAGLDLVTTGKVVRLRAEQTEIDRALWEMRWDSPHFSLQTASTIAGGDLDLGFDGQIDTRRVHFRGASSFDPHAIVPLLPAKTQRWLSRYSWKRPPLVAAAGQLQLPEWTNTGPAWLQALLPTIGLSGQFKIGDVAYRGVDVLTAESSFGLTNFIWTMPNLKVRRPEGLIRGQYASDLRRSEFHWRLVGPLDPKAAEPLLETAQARKILAELQTPHAPWIDCDLWGTWRNVDRLGAAGIISLSNATFRGQAIEFAQTRLLYTNEVLTLLEPKIVRPREEASAPGIQIDFPKLKLYITNAFGNLDPHALVRTIGRQATRALEPFRFDVPPTTRVSGVVDMRKKSYEDELHFEVAGGRFRWQGFQLEQISGKIDWVGRNVSFSELNGHLSAGRAMGEARFDFSPKVGADFSFKVVAAETDLAEVLAGFGRTNKVEGVLSGELVVTSGNSSNVHSWNGHGRVHVRDGLLWDLPMFGMFSPVLNAFMPGLGNSRAREATASYTITNSVVYSRDLEVQATGMRMNFDGTAAFDGRVEARVGAELLRDLPGIGLVLSKVLWPVTKVFEYKVTGTLAQPKAEPLYVIPKLLLFPLQPFKTIRELIEVEPPESQDATNPKSQPTVLP